MAPSLPTACGARACGSVCVHEQLWHCAPVHQPAAACEGSGASAAPLRAGFADLTTEEFRERYFGPGPAKDLQTLRASARNSGSGAEDRVQRGPETFPHGNTVPPKSVNWRDAGLLTPSEWCCGSARREGGAAASPHGAYD